MNASTTLSERRFEPVMLETAGALAISAAAVALPLVLRHPQAVVGSAVNMALILIALHTRGWRMALPVIALPSLAALAGGMLFGEGVARGVLLCVPAIWAGNTALVWALRSMTNRRSRPLAGPLVAVAALKASIIGAGALAATAAGVLPIEFAAPFAAMQFATVVMGGAGAGLISWDLMRRARNGCGD